MPQGTIAVMTELFHNEHLIKYPTPVYCQFSTNMSTVKKIVSVHGENEEGRIVYQCSIGSTNKRATFQEMSLFLQDMGEAEMKKMLDGLHWLLELDSLEKARMYADPASFISKN